MRGCLHKPLKSGTRYVATTSRRLKVFADTVVTTSLLLAGATAPPSALLTSGVTSADLRPQPRGHSRAQTCVPSPGMPEMGPFAFLGTFIVFLQQQLLSKVMCKQKGVIFWRQPCYFLREILTPFLPATPHPPSEQAPCSSHPWPCKLGLSKVWDICSCLSTHRETLQQHITLPARLGEAPSFLPGPPPARCPFLCLLLAQAPAAPWVYRGGMVPKKRRACSGMRAGFNEALAHGHVHLGGGTKALRLSHPTRQSPAGGLPRALGRPWIFIASENGPFTGSRWKV